MPGLNFDNREKATWPAKVRSAGGRTFTTLPTHEQIAKRAREIYLASGCREGQSDQNWFQAERELLTEAVTVQDETEPELEESDESPIKPRGYAPAFRSPRLRLTGSMG